MIFGMVDPAITDYKSNKGAMNMPVDMPMHNHFKMMMDMKNISNDNSTNMHIHH